MTTRPTLKQIIEGALHAAGGPLTPDHFLGLFADEERPPRDDVIGVLAALERDYKARGIELAQVAGGYRLQVRQSVAPWVSRLWDEKPARYSRALLETLALIAYRQPITRGEIEDIRGVAVSTNIIRTLSEREWVRVVGHRDVPGRPALFATTRKFLDYFGLRSLNDLPTLAEIRDPEFIEAELDFKDIVSPEPVGSPDVPAESTDVQGDADGDSVLAQPTDLRNVLVIAAKPLRLDEDAGPREFDRE